MCPVCLELKTYLSIHLRTCGKRKCESDRLQVECDRLIEEEKARVYNLGLVSVGVSEVKAMYGDHWAIVADALRHYGVPIKTETGKDRRLNTVERFDDHLAKHQLRIVRESTPRRVEKVKEDTPSLVSGRSGKEMHGSPTSPHAKRVRLYSHVVSGCSSDESFGSVKSPRVKCRRAVASMSASPASPKQTHDLSIKLPAKRSRTVHELSTDPSVDGVAGDKPLPTSAAVVASSIVSGKSTSAAVVETSPTSRVISGRSSNEFSRSIKSPRAEHRRPVPCMPGSPNTGMSWSPASPTQMLAKRPSRTSASVVGTSSITGPCTSAGVDDDMHCPTFNLPVSDTSFVSDFVSPKDGTCEPNKHVESRSIKTTPCRVILTDISSPDFSPRRPRQAGRNQRKSVVDSDGENVPRSESHKRKLLSDGEDFVPTPKRQAKSATSTDVSFLLSSPCRPRQAGRNRITSATSADPDSGTDSDVVSDDRLRQVRLAKYLEEHHLFIGTNCLQRLKSENQYLIVVQDALKASSLSKCTIRNIIGNISRLMRFYAPGNDPFNFTLENLTSVERLHQLANTLNESGMRAETRIKYYQSLLLFLRRIRKSHYKKSHKHLLDDLEAIKEEVDTIRKAQGKMKGKERMRKLADRALEKDNSADVLYAFNQAIETKLRPAALQVIEKCKASPDTHICSQDILTLNVFFLSLFVKYGHRPIVYTHMPYRRFRQAQLSQPMTDSGNLSHLGQFRYLVTSEHKTGDKDVAYVPLPLSNDWAMLTDYVDYVRPTPDGEDNKKLLFLNSYGHALTNPGDQMKKVFKRFGIRVSAPRVLRHCIETLAFNQLEGKAREEVATALCHTISTAEKYYVDTSTPKSTRGLGHIASFFRLKSKKKSFSPPATKGSKPDVVEKNGVSDIGTAGTYRSVFPTKSEGSAESAESNGERVRPRSDRDARSQFIDNCFTITVDSVPSKAEYEDVLKQNKNEYPEVIGTSYKNFSETCRDKRRKLWAETVVTELGRQRFKSNSDGLKKELMKRGWLNDKTLKLTVREYEKRLDTESRKPQHPPVSAKVSKKISAPLASTSVSIIDDACAKAIRKQDWPLVRKSENEKGKCLLARGTIKKGSVVCEYHGKLLPYAEGHKKYTEDESPSNRYMYCFQYGESKYYIDANDGTCTCHPKKTLKGRLINHSSTQANLKPKVEFFEGRHVVLFQALREIHSLEELLFDYKCRGDSLSYKEEWMNT